MNHEELRQKANSALRRNALSGLIPNRGERITSGLSSSSFLLNVALSGSPLIGYVWGKIIEIFGPEASGKTTLALHAVYEAQRLEKESKQPVPCLFVDAEHALDTYYAECLGINLENTTISQPGCAEDALNEVEVAVKTGFKVIIVDSVSALVPRAEVEGEMGEAHVGLQARIMSQAMRKLAGLVSKSGAIIIFINQIRLKIGIAFGNPETTSGGNALKFYASYRLDVRAPRSGKRTGKTLLGFGDTEMDAETGTGVKVKVVKNKVFPPHRQADFTITYGQGIDKVRVIIAFLEFSGAFKKSRSPKIKSGVIRIESKKKLYTAKGLANILHLPEVQKDVMKIIKKMEIDT
jgi:recombination protein RecA